MRLVRAHLEGYLQSSIPDLVAMGQFQKHFSEKVFFFFFFIREGKGRRGTSVCGYLSHASHWGPGPQPRHVP